MNKLPENWCIKQSAGRESCEWFNKKYDVNSYVGGVFTYLVNHDDVESSPYSSIIPDGYTEITFEQFKQHIMNQLPEKWCVLNTLENIKILEDWRGQGWASLGSDNPKKVYGYLSYDKFWSIGIPHGYTEITFEQFKQHIMKKSTHTVTREQFLEGYELACSDWKQTLTNKFSIALLKSDTIEVEDEFIQQLYGAASNIEQRAFLDKLFPNPNLIQPKDLKMGEAMMVEKSNRAHAGRIVLRTFNGFVDINDPQHTWSSTPSFKGVRVKLKIEVEEC